MARCWRPRPGTDASSGSENVQPGVVGFARDRRHGCALCGTPAAVRAKPGDPPGYQALAVSSAWIASLSSSSLMPAVNSSSWAMLVALAMGAVTAGRSRSQASAT